MGGTDVPDLGRITFGPNSGTEISLRGVSDLSACNSTCSGSSCCCAVTVSGHQIQCRTPPGLGFDFKWFITVGGQTCGDGSGTCDDDGSFVGTTSYRRPMADAVEPVINPA